MELLSRFAAALFADSGRAPCFFLGRLLPALCLLAAALLLSGGASSGALPPDGMDAKSPGARQGAGSAALPPGDEEKARLLQSSVDSAVISLGGVFRTMPDSASRLAAVRAALNSLTFEQGGEVYFTAWNGTRIVHSPLTPDLENTDFSQARDASGRPFVQEMERLAAEGGGFISVTLPRRRTACAVQKLAAPAFALGAASPFFRLYGLRLPGPGEEQSAPMQEGQDKPALMAASLMEATSRGGFLAGLEEEPEPSGLDAAGGLTPGVVAYSRPLDDAGTGPPAPSRSMLEEPPQPKKESAFSAEDWIPWGGRGREAAGASQSGPRLSLPPAPAVGEAEPVRQILYVRSIPGGNWHVAAFMPSGRQPGGQEDAAPPAGGAAGRQSGAGERQSNIYLGLLLSGLSLLGLLGLYALSRAKRGKGQS